MPKIESLDDFIDAYPDYEWLEDRAGFVRYSNGLGEGSEHESEWFCLLCERRGHWADGCDCQEYEEIIMPCPNTNGVANWGHQFKKTRLENSQTDIPVRVDP